MKINIPRSAAVKLVEALQKILFVPGGDESSEPVERPLPFGLKYKLVTDYNSLATVAAEYEVKRREIIKKYGTENEETHEYSIQDEENQE